jgi:hypothetical protein
MLAEYSRAKSKLDKSGVLSTVVAQIRAKSPNGGFVKQDEQDRWFAVSDFLAKEKTSQAFRDALHERYKSSNVSKKMKRQEEQTRATERFRGVTRAYSDGPGFEWLALSGRGDGSASYASKLRSCLCNYMEVKRISSASTFVRRDKRGHVSDCKHGGTSTAKPDRRPPHNSSYF